MEFNFLSNMFISSYPSMSPLISPQQLSNPFIQEDFDEGSYYSPKEICGINDSNKNEEIPEKFEKVNAEDSLEISPKISEIMQSKNPFNEKEENIEFYVRKKRSKKVRILLQINQRMERSN